MTETIVLRAVTLTHVRYRKGDDLGHALAWASLLPVFIGLGGFVTHFIFRRELQAFFFGLGLIVSEIINQVIKDFVQELRPSTCEALEMCDSNGLVLGAAWYFFINILVAPWFPVIENTYLCWYLRIKDSSHIPDVIGYEYMNSRAARMDLDAQKRGKISND
ncbi:hypothetical protein CY35_03G034900 [Sphagnum magellanicum]|nr:hypothetical protein CY35_03G034900 [Sphagnum magellanicum]